MFGNQMLNMIFTPWAADTLFCAARLKVFTLLADSPLTAEELADKTGTVSRYLTAVLDANTAMGFLQKKENRYRNSSLSDIYLVEASPQYLGDIIEVLSAEAPTWDGLLDLVSGRAGPLKPPGEVPPHRFTMGMNNLAMMGEAHALAHAVDLSKAKEMVDVGCGSGIYSVFLCRRFPHLQATLLDRAEVLETTRKIINKHNLDARVATRAADITSGRFPLPMEQSDAVLLSDVLYQEETVCTGVLRSAYEVLKPGSTLVVRGYYSDAHPDGSQSVLGALFNIHQLLSDPNREIISLSLLSQWIEQTGFTILKQFPLTERSYCLIANRC